MNILEGVTATGLTDAYTFCLDIGIPAEDCPATAKFIASMRLLRGCLDQEWPSILNGQIDAGCVLATKLGISNAMVHQWKSDGENVNGMVKEVLAKFVKSNCL
jgi:hypothetical protein